VKTKIRNVVANYNADIASPFSSKGRVYLSQLKLSDSDRFVLDMLLEEMDQHTARLATVDNKLRHFARKASIVEKEAREVLVSIPCVGDVTVDIVLAEVGDIRRFSSQRKATAYAGLAPGIRESAGKRKELGITKTGSKLLRWALVEAAWRLVGRTRREVSAVHSSGSSQQVNANTAPKKLEGPKAPIPHGIVRFRSRVCAATRADR